MATVIRNSIRYGNLDILEDGYGINMMPLAAFAMEVTGMIPARFLKFMAILPITMHLRKN